MTDDREQRAEDRGQMPEDRGQRTEGRGQRTEDRGARIRNWECGLRPVGAIGIYAPEGMPKEKNKTEKGLPWKDTETHGYVFNKKILM